jgi:hypothetical protein
MEIFVNFSRDLKVGTWTMPINVFRVKSNNTTSFYKMTQIPKDTINGFTSPSKINPQKMSDSISSISLKNILSSRKE